jgi:tetratricopeptide (TPR) repeat protein
MPTCVCRPAQSSKIRDILERAIEAHKSGRLDDAKRLYLEILAIDVTHAKSLYGLGLIAHQVGSLDAAARMMQRAIAVSPRDAAYHRGLGAVLREQGNEDEAFAEYETTLKLAPDDEDAHFNLADILRRRGNLAEAERHFNRAAALRPNCSETYESLSSVLLRQGKLDEARVAFERALRHDPNNLVALQNLGNLLVNCGELDSAILHFERALALKPDLAEAYNGMGAAFQDQGKLDAAEASYNKALACNPEFANTHCNLGNLARKRGNATQAIQHYERALAIHPDLSEAHSNLGMALVAQGQLAEARRHYDRAVELEPGLGNARWNRSLLDLLEGKFAFGWQDYDVRRFRKLTAPRSFPQPIWRGEALNGARILLHAEQGLGDTIQFVRYAPLVQEAGGTVILDVKPPMVRLAKQLPGVAEVVGSGDPIPSFEWQCPLMSLPLAFKTNLESIPNTVPYLNAPEDARREAKKIVWPEQSKRIGLVWSGNPEFSDDRLRSIPLSAFESLFAMEGLQFFSLQFGAPASQLKELDAPIVDLTPSINDFADTAALIEKLDLVISVDTAVAHLAGALAKPVWTLLPFAPDWRWMLDREDSPWYPTMRLFRQPQIGDWASVMESMQAELTKMVRQS